MPEILTESFCERCGTRYTFESTAPAKTKKLGRFKTLSKGLKNYVLSDENSLDEALASARSDEERALTSSQLEAFQATFNFCMTCRQYTCANCWNAAEGSCLTCTPLNGHSASPAAFPAFTPLAPAEPLPFEASAWPTTDVSLTSPAKSDTPPPKRTRTPAPNVSDGLARLRTAPADPPSFLTAPAEPVAIEPVAVEPVSMEPESPGPVPSATAAPVVDEAEPDAAELAARLARLTELPVEPVVSAAPDAEPPAVPRLDEAYAAVASDAPASDASAWPIDAEAAAAPDGASWANAEAEATAEADPIGHDPAALLALSEATTLPADIDDRAAEAARRTSELFARLRPRTGIGVELEAFGASNDDAATADEPAAINAIETAEEPIAETAYEPDMVETPAAMVFAEPEIVEAVETAAFAEPEVVGASEAAAFAEPEVVEAPAVMAFVEPEVVEAPEAVTWVAEPETQTFIVEAPEAVIEPEPIQAYVEMSEPVVEEQWPEASIDALPMDLLAVIGPAIEAAPDPVDEVVAEAPEVAAEGEIEVAAEAEVLAEAPEVAAEAAPAETEVVRADVVEQPTWRVVAPDAVAAPTNGHAPHPEPAAPPIAATAATPSQPAAEPQWPTAPGSVAEEEIPFLLSRRTADSPEGLWAASARGVVAAPPKGAPIAAVQTCTSCGLSLSATARFCRRCGSRQD